MLALNEALDGLDVHAVAIEPLAAVAALLVALDAGQILAVDVGLSGVIEIQHGRNTNVTSRGVQLLTKVAGFTRRAGTVTARPAVAWSYGHEGLHAGGDAERRAGMSPTAHFTGQVSEHQMIVRDTQP
jgi:hypothetical protein